MDNGKSLDSQNGDKSLSRLFADKDKGGLIKYFLNDVVDIAKEFDGELDSVEFEDLVSVGNLALSNAVSRGNLRAIDVRSRIVKIIRNAVKSFLLDEIVDRFHVDYDSVKLSDEEHIPNLSKNLELEELVADLDKLLNKLIIKKGDIIKMHLGIGIDNPMGFAEIADLLGIKEGTASGRFYTGIRDLAKSESVLIRLKKHFANPDFSLPKKISTSETKLEKQELDALESEVQKLSSDIELLSGKNINNFVRFYGLSEKNFLDYVCRLYPNLEKEKALRLVEFSSKERETLAENQISSFEKLRDIDSIKRTIRHLETKKERLSSPEKIEMKDQIRELYLPLFVADKEKCLLLLEKEASSGENPEELRILFSGVFDYFREIQNLKIRGLKSELDDYQKVDVEVLTRRKACLIGNEMGTGKSLEAIAYALHRGLNRVLVVSTKSGAISTWPEEFRKHLDGDSSVAILDSATFNDRELLEKALQSNWLVTTHSTAAKYVNQLRAANIDLTVIDECHRINNPNTRQSRALRTLDTPYKIAMSGFLFKNRRNELFPVLNWLFPDEFIDSDDFLRTYCRNEKGLFRLQYELRRRIIMRLKSEVLILPAVEHFSEEVEMDEKTSIEYQAMESDFISWLGEDGIQIHGGLQNIAILMKLHNLRQKAIEPKIPIIGEILKQSIDIDRRKAVLYTTYVSTAEDFRERFDNFGVCYIAGKTPSRDRAKAVEEFKSNSEKRLFIITSAGGESIDLSPASDFIYANKPLTHADEKQGLDRVHRRGQKQSVRAFNITTRDTIDERIDGLLRRKRLEYEQVVHNSRGYVRWFEESEGNNIKELIATMVAEETLF